MEVMEFKNSEDVTERLDFIQNDSGQFGEDEYEIERDVLLNMMFEIVKDDVEFIFGDSIASLKEEINGVDVTFKGGKSARLTWYLAAMVFIRSSENIASVRRQNFRISLMLISLSQS